MSMRVVIVDDEPLARERIRALLANEADIEIAAECGSGTEAVAAVRAHRPDLLFLDIQMPGLDGFGVLRELGAELPLVIFVTAFDEFAVKAFEVHALDYLLKPFKPARLREALTRARAQLAGRQTGDVAQRVLALLAERQKAEEPAWITRIAVKHGDRLRFVKVEDIDWIEASGNYAIIHATGEKHMVRETLGAFEDKLSPKQFARLSRSAIANIERIQEVQPSFAGEHVVVLKGGARIPMTRGLRELQERLRTS
jgi:two-component system, LytTR family, response regulator